MGDLTLMDPSGSPYAPYMLKVWALLTADPEIPGERKPGEQAETDTPAPQPIKDQPEQPVLQDRRRPK